MSSLFSDYACWPLDSYCICQHGKKKHFGFSKTTVRVFDIAVLEEEASNLWKPF